MRIIGAVALAAAFATLLAAVQIVRVLGSDSLPDRQVTLASGATSFEALVDARFK